MSYKHNDQDNQTQDRVLAWEWEYLADIISDWDAWPLHSGLNITPTSMKNKVGGQIRWPVKVVVPKIIGTEYVAADYMHGLIKSRTHAYLDFKSNFSPDLTIPEDELDFYSCDPASHIDRREELTSDAVSAMMENLSNQIWNGAGIMPGALTGLDVGVNDAVGANMYAGVNRTTHPRWQSNTYRVAWILWAGTVSSIIWPLYLRSKVGGKKPTHMICSMSPLTAFHRLMENRQYNTSISPTLGKQSQYHGEPYAMTFMNMILDWGGDHMPNGADGVDIFGLYMPGIHLEYASRSLVVTYPWNVHPDNHMEVSKIRSNCQYAVRNPENHFRLFETTVPEDPTVKPS